MNKFFPFCVAMSLLSIGGLALIKTRKSATIYGLPTENPTALGYVRACGARDIVIGLTMLTQLDRARSLFMLASLIAVADFSIVVLTSEEKLPLTSLTIHGGGALGLMAVAFLSPR